VGVVKGQWLVGQESPQPTGRNRRCWLCFRFVGRRVGTARTLALDLAVAFFVGLFVGFFVGLAMVFFVAAFGAGVAAFDGSCSVMAVGAAVGVADPVAGAARPASGASRLDCPCDVPLPDAPPATEAELARYSCHMLWMRAIWPSENPVRHTSSV